jgi:hypothetical protein
MKSLEKPKGGEYGIKPFNPGIILVEKKPQLLMMKP